MSENGDNGVDDDRPTIRMRAASKDGAVEVTVQGASGERTADVKDVAKNRFDHAVDRQNNLADDDPDGEGFE